MGKIKKWMQTMSRGLAGLMCALLVFENSGMQVLAETMPKPVMEVAITQKEIMDYSSEINEENGVVYTTGTFDGEVTTDGNDILASGIYCEGVEWMLYSNGLLTVTGTAVDSVGEEDSEYNAGWLSWSAKITKAKVQVVGVKNFKGFFEECTNLKEVNFNGTDTRDAVTIARMFKNCSSLTSLDLSGFDCSKMIAEDSMDNFLYGCEDLEWIAIPLNKNSKVVALVPVAMYAASGVVDTIPTVNVYTRLWADWKDAGMVTDGAELPEDSGLLACGKYCEGVTWTLSTNGELTVEGTAQPNQGTMYYNYYPGWRDYAENVTRADINVKDVECLSNFFADCSNLSNINMSDLNTDKVVRMDSMFENCASLTNLDFGGRNTGKVKNMRNMFSGCTQLKTLDLSGFDTSNVTNMGSMFEGCEMLEAVNLSSFDTSNVTGMDNIFAGCSNLRKLDLSNFDCGSLELPMDESHMGMFEECWFREIKTPVNLSMDIILPNTMYDDKQQEYTALPKGIKESVDLKAKSELLASGTYCDGVNWTLMNTGELTIEGTAEESVGEAAEEYTCGWLDYPLDIVTAKVNIKGVKNLSNFFKNARYLEEVDFIGSETGEAVDMSAMFAKCRSLKHANLSGLDTSKVTTMEYMFRECTSLENLDLSMFSTESLTNTRQMFWQCTDLKNLNLSGWKIEAAGNMANMFMLCSSIEQLDLSGFDMAALSGIKGMLKLDDCSELKVLKTPKNIAVELDLPHTMYDKNGVAYTSIPEGLSESVMLVKDMALFETPEDTNDGNDKPGDTETNDGNDKSEGDDTNDGGDKSEDTDTNDGDDKPEDTNTNDGSDKPDNTGTTDGIDADIDLTIAPIPDQTYTGKALKPEVTVTYGRDILTVGKDYTVSYKNNTKAAKADSDKAPVAVVKGKGNFEGTVTIAFNILAKELTESNTEISEMYSYENGKAQTVKPTVKLNGKKMAVGKDYTIEYPDKTEGAYKNPGTYNVIIEGINNYQGSIATTMTVLSENQVMASKLKVGKIAACDYKENEPATPTPKVTYKKEELVLGKDYAITYLNNDRAGKATLIITGLKNTDAEGTYVAGTLKKTFTIKGTALKKAQVEYEKKVTYTGAEICPQVTLTMNGAELVLGKDYSVEYIKNVNVGKATIILTGKGGFTGTVKKTFTIQADASVADKLAVSVAGGRGEIAYNSKGAKPDVKVMLGYNELQIGKDYTVSYKNNKKLAEANATKAPTVVIKGKGNYKFTKTVTFSIIQKFLTDADISIEAADKFVGSKKGYLSAPVVKDANGKKLKVNKDYKIISYTVNGTDFDGKGEVIAGTEVTVTVGGINNYNCWATTTYRIANSDISKTKVNKPTLVYNGGKVEFTEEMLKEGKLEITDEATDRKLVYGTDFIVTGYKNNTKKGTATVTIQGIGEYGGTKNVKFSIVSKKMEKK